MKIYEQLFFILNKYLFKNKIIFVIYSEHEFQERIFERVDFFYKKEALIFKIRYGRRTLKVLTFLPVVKCFFGINEIISVNLTKDWLWYNVDPKINPLDVWEYHYILSRNFDSKKNKLLFIKHINELQSKCFAKCYLFATGSSLELAINKNFNDGYKIVCNTIVKDKKLWNHLSPDIIVAGDALYHFSDSTFAKSFRSDLKKRLIESPNTIFIFPSLFYHFVNLEFREFKNRIIGIPIGDGKDISNNLVNKFELPSYGNVLNLLMLPIGCSISKNIFFWGFDGRAPGDKDFWKNSNKHFYQENVDELKLDHPAFFSYHIPIGNETKYVNNVHGDVLENVLQNAEKKGFVFNTMNFSYTIALQKRIIYD